MNDYIFEPQEGIPPDTVKISREIEITDGAGVIPNGRIIKGEFRNQYPLLKNYPTPVNKQTLLTDEVAALLGLENITSDTITEKSAIPSNALKVMYEKYIKLQEQLLAQRPKKLIATFTTSGTFTLANYNIPTGTAIDAYLVGAGGRNATTSDTTATNFGGGGYCKLIRNYVLTSASYPITVGIDSTTVASRATTAFGTTVNGGNNASSTSGGSGGCGGGGGGKPGGIMGQGGASSYRIYWSFDQAWVGTIIEYSYTGGAGGGDINYDPFNPYDSKCYGRAGGGLQGQRAGDSAYRGEVQIYANI